MKMLHEIMKKSAACILLAGGICLFGSIFALNDIQARSSMPELAKYMNVYTSDTETNAATGAETNAATGTESNTASNTAPNAEAGTVSEEEGKGSAESASRFPEKRQSVIIVGNAGCLDSEEEEKIRSLMEQLSVFGKISLITYYNHETHFHGRDTTYGKYYPQFVADDLNNSDYFSDDGIVVIVDYYHREIGIYRNGKMQTAISGTYAYVLKEKAQKIISRKDHDVYGGAAVIFNGMLKIIESGQKTRPLRIICYLLLAVSVSLMTGLLLVFRGRTDQYPDIGDLTGREGPGFAEE